jgi:hypothetical protein
MTVEPFGTAAVVVMVRLVPLVLPLFAEPMAP